MEIEKLDPKKFIIIKGAKVNNLKNISLAIPRNKFVVISGLSGSGKSSLAFDTLFAEGQRMYVESLSSYARQFLGKMEKPAVDYIKGISPAIAIEQKIQSKNPRSTVGTISEVYDYLKLLFARIGKTFSPVSGMEVKRDTVTSVVNYVNSSKKNTKVMITCPLRFKEGRGYKEEFSVILSKGYNRVLYDNRPILIEDILDDISSFKELTSIEILIDRLVVDHEEDTTYRLSDSIQTSFYEGLGKCIVYLDDKQKATFSDKFECDGIIFQEPTVHFFSFNNPFGACKNCEGFGSVIGIDPDLVIPDRSLSVYEGAIVVWRSEKMKKWLNELIKHSHNFDFPIHRPYQDLTKEQKKLLWEGNEYFEGIDNFFAFIQSQAHKIQYRVLLSRYRGKTLCPECRGTRLRKDTNNVKIGDESISDLLLMPIKNLMVFFNELKLSDYEIRISNRLLKEINDRLFYIQRVGLDYLTLNRMTSTLSGGEYQRIKLANSLGSALVGSLYILDEPSIGLHPRDSNRLVKVLKELRDLGNTVIVVEHEQEIIEAADHIIDIGPNAGLYGGNLIFEGTPSQLSSASGHTAAFMTGREKLEISAIRRKWNTSVDIIGAKENNLKNLNVSFPLGIMTVVTGVSGSGKSTLVRSLLYPALTKILGTNSGFSGKYHAISGDYKKITQVEMIDQNPIGKSSRSNPITYVKAFDNIRQLFAEQQLSKNRGYKPSHFSFNVVGGRCENCQGDGEVKVEMQFMADIFLTCEDCKGKRFKQEILDVEFKNKNIAQVLNMSIEESLVFFKDQISIIKKIKPLFDVGLGYVALGQSSNSLSGGEAQRVKLAYYLGKNKKDGDDHILFIFDEPTTGLHFHDISKLLFSINALVDQGNSVIIIEHNIEVIKSADWIIDIGPEGGEEGGTICFAGKPEDMVRINNDHTSAYLRKKL